MSPIDLTNLSIPAILQLHQGSAEPSIDSSAASPEQRNTSAEQAEEETDGEGLTPGGAHTSGETVDDVLSVIELPAEFDVETLIDSLMRRQSELPLPVFSGLLAPVRRPRKGTLVGVAEELSTLRRDASPGLVGIDYNRLTLSELGEHYRFILAIAPDERERRLQSVLKYMPAVFKTPHARGVGSARVFSVSIPDGATPSDTTRSVHRELRIKKGEPLHEVARAEFDFVAFTAPEEWTGTTRDILEDFGPVVAELTWDRSEIHVAGFVFNNSPVTMTNRRATDESTPETGDTRRRRSNGGPAGPDRQEGGTSRHSDRQSSDESPPEPSPDNSSEGSSDTSQSATESSSSAGDKTTTPTSPPGDGRDRSSETSSDGGTTMPSETTGPPEQTGNDKTRETPESSEPPTQSPSSQNQSLSPDGTDSSGSGDSAPDSDDNNGDDDNHDSDDNNGDDDNHDSELMPSPGDSSSTPGDLLPDETTESSDSSDSPPDSSAPDSNQGPTTSPSGTGDDTGSDENRATTDPSEPGSANPNSSSATATTDEEHDSSEGATSGAEPGGTMPSESGDVPEGSSLVPDTTDTGPSPHGDDSSGPPSADRDDAETPGFSSDDRPQNSDGANPPLPGVPTTNPGTGDNDDDGTDRPASEDDQDTTTGRVPADEASPVSDSSIVDIAAHVLNEVAFHAVSMVISDDSEDTEVYGTFYENANGLIRYYHPIDSEEFVRRRRRSISFTPAFYQHLRRLAEIHEDIGHRLCGGGHSHPNGIPKQSSADKRFSKRIWRNERNQMLIIGVAQGDGPKEWEVADDGTEVQRESSGYLIRVRAYAGGTNNAKKFRVHTDMGG